MLNDVVVAGAEVAETDKRDETWAKNLRPGNKNLARIRSAPLHERAAAGLGLQYGATSAKSPTAFSPASSTARSNSPLADCS